MTSPKAHLREIKPALTWRLTEAHQHTLAISSAWPTMGTGDWALGDATGKGVRVCLLDSGVDSNHPLVGPLSAAFTVARNVENDIVVTEDSEGDSCGHGTACASIIRSVAPECELVSVRVLNGTTGGGEVLLSGLRWAVRNGFDVVNLSLSTNKPSLDAALRQICDEAYFSQTLVVASAHNLPIESYPWRYSSTISVGSHMERDSGVVYYNPTPPVEFFAHGQEVTVARPGGGTHICSGNSFATPHITGRCALILSKYHELTPFQVKSLLYLTSKNVG
jgi:subtilisin